MMTRDPLISFNIEALLQGGQNTHPLQAAKHYRLRAQECADRTKRILESARKTLDASFTKRTSEGDA